MTIPTDARVAGLHLEGPFLVVLEEDLTVRAVLYRGSWVDGWTP